MSTDDVLDFIRAFIAERGYSPTVREIQTGLSFSSPSMVQSRLAALRAGGEIDWVPGLTRTIRILEEDEPCTS